MFYRIDVEKGVKHFLMLKKYKFEISSKKDRRKTQKKIHKIIRKHNIPNTHHEYVRAIGNGMAHGECPVKCLIYLGSNRKMIMIITDSGKGFDYNDVVHKFEHGAVYYHHKGYGMRCYSRNTNLYVDWRNNGKTIILYYNHHDT